MKLKDLPVQERPRERLKKNGKEFLSNEELLAIIIKTGTKGMSVKEIACNILNRLKTINKLENINFSTFKDIKGLGEVKTMKIMASMELKKRIIIE